MSKSSAKPGNQGDGTDFIDLQRAIDEGKNERMKAERDGTKLDPTQVNRGKNRENTPDVSVKKTGGGEH